MDIVTPFVPADAGELMILQRCCWVSEAIVNDNLEIPALHEDVDDVLAWSTSWTTLCLRRGCRLIGAVRAQLRPDRSWEIGRLMVAPDLSGQGLGRELLSRVEGLAPPRATRFILFTGDRSTRNIRMYRRAGYRLTDPPEEASAHHDRTVFLEKPVTAEVRAPSPAAPGE